MSILTSLRYCASSSPRTMTNQCQSKLCEDRTGMSGAVMYKGRSFPGTGFWMCFFLVTETTRQPLQIMQKTIVITGVTGIQVGGLCIPRSRLTTNKGIICGEYLSNAARLDCSRDYTKSIERSSSYSIRKRGGNRQWRFR